MARAAKKTAQPKSLEQRLWEAADALRGNQEPSEYKHVVLGLVFLKYISAVTPSRCGSTTTWPPPRSTAQRCSANACTHTCFATAAR